jgi:hypothetical protein
MLLDVLPALGRELVGDEVEEQFGEFATGDHAACSSK